MSKTQEMLKEVFLEERNAELVRCLGAAYQNSIEVYMPNYGHDGMVFGLMVYKSAIYELTDLSYSSNWLEIVLRNPRFLMKIGRYTVATYKVGDAFDVVPEEAFPNNRVGAFKLTQANRRQMLLPFPEETGEFDLDSSCTNLILAHAGNEEEGLLRVFVGIPSEFNDRHQITAWSHIFEIWNKSEDEANFFGVDVNQPKVPVESVQPPAVTLKSKSKVQGNNG